MIPARGLEYACLLAGFLLVPSISFAQDSKSPDRFSSEDTRLTTGVDQSASSSSPSSTHLLIDFMLTAPLSPGNTTRRHKPVLGAWINTRFSGSPTQTINVSQFVGGFQQELVKDGTSSVLDTLTMMGGLELSMGNGFTFGDDYQFQPLLIGGVGVTTTGAPSTKPPIFQLDGITSNVREALGVPADSTDLKYKYVAFIEPDRHRFYRQYAFGVRLKSHHFDSNNRDTRQNFPGIIDITVGRDEAITAGNMAGYVLRADAFYPLPTNNKANSIYVFGTAEAQRGSALGVKDEYDQIVLKPATEAVTLPDKTVYQRTITAADRTRDRWRFGVGVDLIRLFTDSQKARDEAAQGCTEGGFSRVTDLTNDTVMVTRLVAQNTEEACFRHTADILLPLKNAKYDVLVDGKKTGTLSLVADVPVVAGDTKRTLKNVSDAQADSLLIRVKTSGKNDEAAKNPLTIVSGKDAAGKDTQEKPIDSLPDHYEITRISCAMTCTAGKDVKTSDALLFIPVADGGAIYVVDDKGGPHELKAHQAVFIPKNAQLHIGAVQAGQMFTVDSFIVRIH